MKITFNHIESISDLVGCASLGFFFSIANDFILVIKLASKADAEARRLFLPSLVESSIQRIIV